jgi:alkylated DNA repair dioxygenase AlkB
VAERGRIDYGARARHKPVDVHAKERRSGLARLVDRTPWTLRSADSHVHPARDGLGVRRTTHHDLEALRRKRRDRHAADAENTEPKESYAIERRCHGETGWKGETEDGSNKVQSHPKRPQPRWLSSALPFRFSAVQRAAERFPLLDDG